ncbi:fibronectin type III domain-containing protein [Nonomuraea angiospora]|uniref:fibronectin type III domain-containing protein n=1 Tax=Nonomuraea angiospora TaxID=46172 RepID=UPI00344BF7CD
MQVITSGTPEPYALRLVAHAPNGGRLGVLPHHLGFEVAFPLNDVPSLKVTYPAAGVGSQWLEQPVEVAVEYAVAGGQWAEPDGARFLRIKRGADATDQSGTRTYECPGWSWQLRKLIMYAGGTMTEGKRVFSAVTPGALLRTLVQEAHDRGALPGLSIDFTSTHDSTPGTPQPWDNNKLLTLELEPGVDLLTLLINLSEQGVLDWTMTGRTLHVYREGTILGRQHGSGAGAIDLRLGRDIDEAPDTATLEDLATAILIKGEKGLTVEVTNSSATAPWGRWETSQSQSGVSDAGTATLLGQNALERAGRERAQLTRGIRVEAARFLPLAHYRPGDYIRAPGDRGEMQPLRVRQITLTVDADRSLSGNVTLNDRFLEREIRLARQAAGILAGGVGSGGTGGTPAPEPGGRAPAPPAGLVVGAAAYIDASGTAQGQITASWSPVVADPAGVAIEVDSYELYGRENNAGGIWQQVAVVEGSITTATYSPLRVNVEYAFKVRAVADGVMGAFSEQTIVLIPDDTTKPPVPSTPTVTTRLGMIHVGWDGLGSAGEVMPLDFDRVKVWMADPLVSGSAQVVDSMRVTETVVVGGQPYNVVREFWLTAIDRSGNESAQSGHVTVSTQPLVDTDLIGKVISGANIINGTVNAADAVIANTITGALVQALAIDTGHLKANAVTVDKLAAGSVTAGKLEAILTLSTRVIAGNPTGARVELNSTGLRGFNASGVETVSLTNTGSFTLRTAASGPRVQLDNTGLKAFNSSGEQTVDVNSTGAATIVGQISTAFSGKRIIFNPAGTSFPQIRFTPSTGSQFAKIEATSDTSGDYIGMYHETSTWSNHRSWFELFPAVARLTYMGDLFNGGPGGVLSLEDSGVSLYRRTSAGTAHGIFIDDTNVFIMGSPYKSFIIDHPTDPDRWLVHACTESPHAGVEYWGETVLDDRGLAVVELPSYFEALTRKDSRAVAVNTCAPELRNASASYPEDGKFTIFGGPGVRVTWIVKAVRADADDMLVEPRRDQIDVHGDGPYRYYTIKEPQHG